MPHTLRDVTAADEEAASLTMPAGSGPGPGAPGRPRPRAASGACTPRPRPALEAVLGPHLARDAVLEAIAAWPTPTALRKAGKARIDARLKKHGARRHAAWAQQVCDALDKQTVALAGTDAAGAVLPHLAHPAHLPARPEGRAPRPCPGPTTRARRRGPGRRRPPGRDTGQDPRHRSPAGLIRRPGAGDQEVGVLDQGREASPTQATSGSREPCSCLPSPPCAPTPSAAPTTSANETRQTPGPSRNRPGPPPRPDPARHDPKRHPLRSTASSTATHRRLTHPIGAPPPPRRPTRTTKA